MQAKTTDLVSRLSWDKVAARIENGAAAVLPIGAGAKEHGFHLPMNTDELQAEWLAACIAGEIDALVWPTLTYGYYPAFVNYAGSLTLSANTFIAVLSELIDGLASMGAGDILVVDTGISTLAPVAKAIAGSGHNATKAHHLKVHDGPRYGAAIAELCEQKSGSHADEMETSRMLALAPAHVDMSRATASPPGKGKGPGPLTPHDSSSANYSPSGSWGDPTLATREKGEALLAAMAEDVVEMARHAITS